ncbi:hypothetical protein [Cupriavidus metallidurans]|uniref:hypothetical protein n=1 Tax=Cupriavidus metallidurans TaxID=119219 RepID=UPI0016475554|nr:hypothetical protein [Cupriavidus metallidurans]
MKKANTPEAELQKWFEDKAERYELCDCIENLKELEQKTEALEQARRLTDKTSLAGLKRARRICDFLYTAELLSANRSVAPADSNQMRPDLVLFTESAHYILVELKTQPGPERQGVQELLAYSAAMKMQMPYVNDFVYIIVADQWDDLLWYGVRSLIMDGKYVLPLQGTKKASGNLGPEEVQPSFSLNIVLELFDFDFTQHFEPLYALVPHTIAVDRFRKNPRMCVRMDESLDRLDRYFVGLAKAAVADCEKLFQTGFALIWSNQTGPSSEIVSLTLATVSQHWMLSEHAPDELRTMKHGKPEGLEKLIISEAREARKLALKGRDKRDVFERAFVNDDASRFFPQNDFSFDVIARHQVDSFETEMWRKGITRGLFDFGSPLSLSLFLQDLVHTGLIHEGRLRYFLPFGELAEFIRTGGAGDVGRPQSLWNFHDLMAAFDEFKVTRPGVQWNPDAAA